VLSGTFANVARPSPTGGIDSGTNSLRHASKEREIVKSRVSEPHLREDTDQVYPYRVHSFNSYFGDYELLPGKPKVRSSTVRCETTQGSCLGLAKDDFHSIVDRFPQFASPWVVLGQRRDLSRIQQRRRLHVGFPLKSFSALCIQRYWRTARTWKGSRAATDGPCESHHMDRVFSMRPLEPLEVTTGDAGYVAGDTGTCTQNGGGDHDLRTLKRDISELRDTMRFMVTEMASFSRSMQSMRSEFASIKMSL